MSRLIVASMLTTLSFAAPVYSAEHYLKCNFDSMTHTISDLEFIPFTTNLYINTETSAVNEKTSETTHYVVRDTKLVITADKFSWPDSLTIDDSYKLFAEVEINRFTLEIKSTTDKFNGTVKEWSSTITGTCELEDPPTI